MSRNQNKGVVAGTLTAPSAEHSTQDPALRHTRRGRRMVWAGWLGVVTPEKRGTQPAPTAYPIHIYFSVYVNIFKLHDERRKV